MSEGDTGTDREEGQADQATLEPGVHAELPLVSVIIPVRDDPRGLRRCLIALSGQSYPSLRTEIIVVDNGSSTPIGDVTGAFAGVILESEGRLGSYAARNRGLAVARGDLVAFTDADCIPAQDWLQSGVEHFSLHPRCGLMAGRVEVFTESDRPGIAELLEVAVAFKQDQYASADHFAATANAWVRRPVLDRVPGFDAALASGGDADFGSRVHAAGFVVCYSADTRVRHPARTMRGLLRKTRRLGVGLRDRHAIRGPSRGASARLAVTRLFPYAAAYKVLRRLPGSVGPLTKAQVFALTVAVRQYYYWSYVMHRPSARPRQQRQGP